MLYNKTIPYHANAIHFLILLLSIGCLLIFNTSCKKSMVDVRDEDKPNQPLQLPHGKPIGEITTMTIGEAGGTLISRDGVLKIEIPAGALTKTITVSVQEVENVLKNRGKSFRILPANMVLKKPINLIYDYGNLHLDGLNPDFLFLTYQDKAGYFFSANRTKGRQQTQTLFVQTTHFGDWNFYARYDLYYPNHTLVNGELRLTEDEEAIIGVRATLVDNYDTEYGQMLKQETTASQMLQKAVWDYSPKKGLINNNQANASITYKTSTKVGVPERVYIETTVKGDLAVDNLGNKLKNIQLTQAIVINKNGYFILSENGVDMASNDFGGQFIPALGPEIVANFPNGYNLSCFIYGKTGRFPYNQHGVDDSAVITLSKHNQGGMFVFRSTDCEKREGLTFSKGSFNMKTIATKSGEYFEGDFTVTLYDFDFCKNGITKNLSGRFKFKK
jgi:hypothetical protein